MPKPSEHKTLQARILKYAEEIGWTFVPHEDVPVGERVMFGWARVKRLSGDMLTNEILNINDLVSRSMHNLLNKKDLLWMIPSQFTRVTM